MKPFSLIYPGLAEQPGCKSDQKTGRADERHGVRQIEQRLVARLSNRYREKEQDCADEGDPADG